MAIDFKARMKYYANTPEMIARIGKWKNDILGRVGAYGKGVFRNKLSRPQLQQKKERTVRVLTQYTDRKTGRIRTFDGTIFVPREGPIVNVATGKLAPRAAAIIALDIVSQRLKGQGAGKPPRRGKNGLLKKHNDSQIDPKTESVVIGTIPLPGKKGRIQAASRPQMLNEGLVGWVENHLDTARSHFATYAAHPYVQTVLEPCKRKMTELITRKPI